MSHHLARLFPGLHFKDELARRILTHSSHPSAVNGHNATLSFIGRRVLESYLLLLLSASSQLTPAHDLEQIVARTLNSYILGEHVGSAWGLGQIMYWTPSVKASKLESKKVNSTALLRSVGLYKVQGETVAAVVGGTFREFGGSTAHRIFHTRVLPHLLLSQRDVGLPELFHRDARAACAEMGGIHGPLLSSN